MTSVRVVPAGAGDESLISLLMKPYLIELGQSTDYEYLPCYWREPESRFPYLIKMADQTAGFALVRREHTVEMAEFYVTPQYRRNRTGQSAVAQLLERHPGDWTISIDASNNTGQAFWSNTLSQLLHEKPAVSHHDDRIVLHVKR